MTDAIRAGNLLPVWRMEAKDKNGPRPFADTLSVRVRAWLDCEDAPVIDSTNSHITKGLGFIEYEWQEGDTDTVQPLFFRVDVTWVGGKPETFPTSGYLKTIVHR